MCRAACATGTWWHLCRHLHVAQDLMLAVLEHEKTALIRIEHDGQRCRQHASKFQRPGALQRCRTRGCADPAWAAIYASAGRLLEQKAGERIRRNAKQEGRDEEKRWAGLQGSVRSSSGACGGRRVGSGARWGSGGKHKNGGR